MNGRVAGIAAAGAALLGLVFLVRPGPQPPGTRPPRPTTPAARAVRPEPTPAPVPERNVFEFAQPTAPRASAPPRPTPVPSAEPSTPPAEPVPPAVRLVGLVHRNGALRAALSIRGNVVILGLGEEAEGYRVLSIDEDAGIRLRGPDGVEQALAPAPSR